ncbi:MAG TPA: S8 family serine peptidase [Blastocatellia bacterium]|nr:S8 family serine peptidase [Blastocatellia bacterium]
MPKQRSSFGRLSWFVIVSCAALILRFALHSVRRMDLVRSETRADQATARFNATGRNVLVAILDRGIDWANEDFRNDDGTTRIEYIFDLTDDSGAKAPGNPYNAGTLYTMAQINAALRGGAPLKTRDAVGHGTASAGIACGNGRNLPDRKYRGIAPNAGIIAVKLVSDGAPAHDGESEEQPYYDRKRIPIAIEFVRDKARQLRRPCVMLLNIGSQGGPTDGTSDLCRKIDQTVGPGKPGIIFVSGPGDDGGLPNRAAGNVRQNETVDIEIEKGAEPALDFDLWYSGADRLDVTILTPRGTFGPYPSPRTNDDATRNDESEFELTHLGSNRDYYASTNGKRELFIRLRGRPGRYVVRLKGATAPAGNFDATINPSQLWRWSRSNRVLTHVAAGSIWDGATARYNICPGDYVGRARWVDLDGVEHSMHEGDLGAIWDSSSTGPTFDGRLGVDVCAPGDVLFTTCNPRSYYATFRGNLIREGKGFYGKQSAVSAAAPIVVGIIALMLERNPQLDAPTVKTILQKTARRDGFTGPMQNPTWGYGKVDALAAVASSRR